jgi:hypothetical protein
MGFYFKNIYLWFMISVVELYNDTQQLMKSGTSGYTTQNAWNSALSSVQKELIEYLFPFFENNTQVQDALGPFVKSVAPASVTSAGLTKPSEYAHFLSASIDGYPVYPQKSNSKAIINNLSIRQPSTIHKLYYYYMEDDKIKFLPSATHIVGYTYIRKPADASIVLTAVSSDDDDYITATAGADLEWPSTMFNMILYMMLDRLGLEQKEQIIMQYANLGIQKEAIKL